ncbi:CBS domain-containing protein [candidate division KSB1 bacterium]|nr:CBS domain-containing protein [candidate division KSB1 bacterium]
MTLLEVLNTKGKHVFTIRPRDSVLDAVHTLVARNIGALAVLDDGGKLVGVISERDVLRLHVQSPVNLATLRVAEFMTREVITATLAYSIDQALAVMSDARIRHLPVVENGILLGIISQGDLVKSKLDEVEFDAKQLTSFITGKYPG